MMDITKILHLKSNAGKKEEANFQKFMEAKQELENAWRIFNEVTEHSYIDIAIMNLNLAKKKFDVVVSELKGA